LIKSETVIDKIHELINPIEIDFPDDVNFNKSIYVVTDDDIEQDPLINESFRNQVKQIPVKEFIIEIFKDKLIIGNRKVIDQDSAIDFAKFMSQISG
jgi:hypothetical protein